VARVFERGWYRVLHHPRVSSLVIKCAAVSAQVASQAA
jgi:hypothetical protein